MFWEWQRLSYQKVPLISLYFLLAVISISACLSVLPSLIIHVNCEIIGAEQIVLTELYILLDS